MTWLWLLPSIIALLIKCFLFFHSDIRKQYFLISLVATFFCLNLLELLGFFRLGYDLLWLKLYHCTAVFLRFLYRTRMLGRITKLPVYKK